MNPYSENERQSAMIAAAYIAVQEHFSHLPLRDIINPPHDQFDAALARQCAVHIIANIFHVPRRRLTRVMGRQRTSTNFALDRIETRREEPLFKAAHDRMGERAASIFLTDMKEAAMRLADAA